MSVIVQSPGLYVMSEAEYRADPCPEPSLNQSIAKILLQSCAYAAWYVHPRLNEGFHKEEEDKFVLANVAHRLILGRGKEYRTVKADDWRSTASREQKQAIRNSGHVPILEHQLARAADMVNAAKFYLSDHPDGVRIFKPDYGDGEMVIACLDKEGCWTRAMVDWLEHRSPDENRFLCVDYKTTGLSANPANLTKDQKLDWAFQAAFQKRILNRIKPNHQPRFLFLVQETEEPYLCSLNEPSVQLLKYADAQVALSLDLWNQSLRANIWPGYAKVVKEFDAWMIPPVSEQTVKTDWNEVARRRLSDSERPKRGRPKMTVAQKEEARAKREAAKVAAAEYTEERKEVVINDTASHD